MQTCDAVVDRQPCLPLTVAKAWQELQGALAWPLQRTLPAENISSNPQELVVALRPEA